MSRRFAIAVACCALSGCGGSDGSGDESAQPGAGMGSGAVPSGGGAEPGGAATGAAGTSGDGSGAVSAGGDAFEPIYGRWGEEPQNTFTLPLSPAAAGDAGFRGHAEGQYAHSQGTYGIVIDDAFSKVGLTGLAVGGGASDFELDCFEVARAEFAGIVAKSFSEKMRGLLGQWGKAELLVGLPSWAA